MCVAVSANPTPRVRYVLPSDDKMVQKLLLLYMEIIEKTDDQGKLLPEMILICQNLRNNLQHPNEFLRGKGEGGGCTRRVMWIQLDP
jgi:hypothetical protein